MYVEVKINYVLSKFKPKQLCLEYHKMKSTISTLDESRKEFKPSGFAQTHFLDENNKKIDENHNNPKKLNSQSFTLTTRVKPFLTLDESRKEFKPSGFAQTHFLDKNNKKIDENQNNPKKLNSQFFTLTTRVKPFLTKSCNRAELKMNSHVIYHKDYG
jgi:hypothetical protein